MARNMRYFREMFRVPAERMEYYYVLREDMPDPPEGIIGAVLNDSLPDLQLLLEVDDDYLTYKKVYQPVLYVDPEDYLHQSRIVLNRTLARQLLEGSQDVVFALWHELGHFHTMEEHAEEYVNYMNTEDGGFTAEQYMAIIEGKVMDYEAAADDFAADYCGFPDTVIALNGMIARAKKNPATMNDRGLIKDLLNRKNRLAGRAGNTQA